MGSKGWESALGGIGYGYREDIANNKTSRLILGAGVQESTLDEGSDAARMGLGGIASRANGGPVYSGRPYLVGERGPEIVVPQQSGYVFPNQRRKRRRTNAFFPSAPENYTPANRMPAMPDLSGDTEQQGMSPTDSISQLVSLQSKPKGDGRFPVVDPNTVGVGLPGQDGLAIQENPNLALNSTAPQEKKGIYDDWKQPVFGNMPLDKFVQLTGMMANAVAPNEWSGRLGRDMANMAGQAGMDRRAYEEREQQRADINKRYEEQREEREQQRADINKRYEEQRKEHRLDKVFDLATQTKNVPLAKAAYGKLKEGLEKDFGMTLPDTWDPDTTPAALKKVKEFEEGAKSLGLSDEAIKTGRIDVLKHEYGIEEKKKTDSDKSKTKEKLAVYVDTVSGARHVVNLFNQKHREWLAKYGKQLRAEKDFEKDVVTPEEGMESPAEKKLTYNPKTGKFE